MDLLEMFSFPRARIRKLPSLCLIGGSASRVEERRFTCCCLPLFLRLLLLEGPIMINDSEQVVRPSDEVVEQGDGN